MLNLLPDVGAPGIVAGVNIMARQSTSTVLGQPMSDALVYLMTAAGYLGGYMNWGGRNSDLVKNIGIASAPLAMEKIYDALKSGTSTPAQSRVTQMKRVSRYPAGLVEPEFQGVRLSAAPGRSILI